MLSHVDIVTCQAEQSMHIKCISLIISKTYKHKILITTKSEAFLLRSSFGRDDKTRTCDLAPPRRVRYQLRYIPIPYCLMISHLRCKGMTLFCILQIFFVNLRTIYIKKRI